MSTLPRSDFPGSHGVKNSTDYFFFLSARITKFFFLFLCFLSRRMQTLQRARNVWRLNSQISQDGPFVHYPFFFVLNIPLFTFSYRIFSRYLFVLTYFDSSRRHTHATTHVTGTQIVRAKMTSLDAIFCRGNKSSSRSLARFSRRKHKNLPLALRAREKELSSTCGQVYIGTNIIAVHIKSVAKFSRHKCTII